jgi:mannose-1-phosphate guanylyltransferase
METSVKELRKTNPRLGMNRAEMFDTCRVHNAVTIEREHEWAVILAGGDGARLKLLTRKISGDERPKQFCPVIGEITLVEETEQRVILELRKERTVFVVNRVHEPYYSTILGDTPARNLVEQPRNIGTAPAILYSVLKIATVDPQAIVAVFPSDHYVSDGTRFIAHVRSALNVAHSREDLVILLGIEAASPETEYGWIEPAEVIPGYRQVHRVRRFWEKPDFGLAAVLQARGCLWNSFVMVASARVLIDIFARTTPALYDAFTSITPLLGGKDEPAAINKLYALLTEINFSDQVLAIVPDRLAVLIVSGVEWNDLGAPKRVLASMQTAGLPPGWSRMMRPGFTDRSCATHRARRGKTVRPSHPSGAACESRAEPSIWADTGTKCGRCLQGGQARYRAYTDVLNVAVCSRCADDARKLGLSVEEIHKSPEAELSGRQTSEVCWKSK